MFMQVVDFLYGSNWSTSVRDKPWLNARAILWCTWLIGASGLIAHGLDVWLNLKHVSVIFLPAVVICAVVWGMLASILAVLLTLAATSFFFYEPVPNFRVDDPREFLDLVIFTLVGIAMSQMAAFARQQAMAARRRADDMARLQSLSRKLADAAEPQAIANAIVEQARGKASANLYEPQAGLLALVASEGPERPAMVEAQRHWAGFLQTKDGRKQSQGDGWSFHLLHIGQPLNQGGEALGMLALQDDAEAQPAFLAALLDQAASALHRGHLAAAMEDSRVERRTKRLREAVIDAISHDLRTPLAAIMGAASTLESFGTLCGEAERAELLDSIREQCLRLDSNFAKLLDLSQIRAGELLPKSESVELADLVQAALHHGAHMLRAHRLEVALPMTLPLLTVDSLMLQHALDNLLENAAKYSPPGSIVRIGAHQDDGRVILDVSDRGIGINAADMERIFEPFHRAEHPPDGEAIAPRPPGKGLGLAIARAFVEANGGSLQAISEGEGRGATFRIILPVSAIHGSEA
ncbi:ATP-binding protein [Ferrovibrio sp.]|uniref:sensor histidine kinase n=1 Tax=Ferrovibrio sp. TaxID=1917215 RepID=UPI0035B139FE